MKSGPGRRDVLKIGGTLPAACLAGRVQAATPARVALVVPQNAATPVTWAAGHLQQALTNKGVTTQIVTDAAMAGDATHVVMICPLDGSLPAEGFRLAPDHAAATPTIRVTGADARGAVYALLELMERVAFGVSPADALHMAKAEQEQPTTPVRSIARIFSDEPHDKPWFQDKNFWPGYLDLLVACRFNRFNLALGLAYDFPRGVTGDYLHFAYPYLLTVPGYDVKAVPLAQGEREKNWDVFRFIAAETAKRGLEFQVGIWTHAYEWTDSPNSDHHITGLNPQNHAAYCRDALTMLLQQCPEITGITLRIHGESGIPEGSYDFWQTVYDAFPKAGRIIEIEMHAKGLNHIMIDMAKKTGMRVAAGPKYSAEHQSLGYHQADIRAFEIPSAENNETGVFSVSNGARRFTRYGYADLYEEGSGVGLIYRLWPGTQRHLLKGDGALAAAMARSATFCGARGLEIMEPLTFKGREGSSVPGGRNAYADPAMNPPEGDFAKFEISYRQWGRTLYNPDANPDVWRRSQAVKLGPGADAAQDALAYATRILALLTSAHLPSASNHAFWYEIYVNMPILPGPTPFTDTFDPKVFGNCSPLDPQLFSSMFEHVDDLLANRISAKYSPVEVTAQVDDLTAMAKAALATAKKKGGGGIAFRRLEEDVALQIALGEFFVAKFRAAMLFRIFEKTHNAAAGNQAITWYEKARTIWVALAERGAKVYLPDITYGKTDYRRGTWGDALRMGAIDKDIAVVKAAVKNPDGTPAGGDAARAIRLVLAKPSRPVTDGRHVAPQSFHPGRDLVLALAANNAPAKMTAVLHYRHVDQAERWTAVPMTRGGHVFKAAIPASYTQSAFPLQYYFELRLTDAAWLYPAFNRSLSNQPYYAVFKRA